MKAQETHDEPAETDAPPSKKHSINRFIKPALITLAVIVLVPALLFSYIYIDSPGAIRKPKLDHYHFRMQILVNGQAENFGQDKYQIGYSKDQCDVRLPEQPIHFHDNKDQFVHIHWDNMTGGMVMKYYGWNFIGGTGGALGYRFDDLKHIKRVPIHGSILPESPRDANFYVYIGDEHEFQERSFDDWKRQDLETFFGKASNLPSDELSESQSNWLHKFFPRAHAHEIPNETSGNENESTEERLERINNLIGNVVIFVQKDKPTDEQVKQRFNSLAPLSESTCSG